MSTQSLAALSAVDAVSEEDYQAFVAALSASARALDEHARWHRQADRATLLEAIARLEAQHAAQPSRADVADELNALSESVRSMSSQIDATQLTAAVTKLAATVENLSAAAGVPAVEPQPASAREAKPVEAPSRSL